MESPAAFIAVASFDAEPCSAISAFTTTVNLSLSLGVSVRARPAMLTAYTP